jgi:hypothetical protein
LGQDEDKKTYAVYFLSKDLSSTELNYTITKKEFLAVAYALNKFRHYVTRYRVFLHTNHYVIKYLMNKLDINGRTIRWLLLLWKFGLRILDKTQKKNVVVDLLSRLTNPTDEDTIDDRFPYEHLFTISIQTP